MLTFLDRAIVAITVRMILAVAPLARPFQVVPAFLGLAAVGTVAMNLPLQFLFGPVDALFASPVAMASLRRRCRAENQESANRHRNQTRFPKRSTELHNHLRAKKNRPLFTGPAWRTQSIYLLCDGPKAPTVVRKSRPSVGRLRSGRAVLGYGGSIEYRELAEYDGNRMGVSSGPATIPLALMQWREFTPRGGDS